MAFKKICERFGTPEVDLFASRVNSNFRRYTSWKKDPGAMTADAFTVK